MAAAYLRGASALNLHLLALNPIPKFDRSRTSNWKGYTATWEIRDSKLYLTAFHASIDGQSVPINKLFPKRELPIFANWFSGSLNLLSAERERAPHPVFKEVTQVRVRNGAIDAMFLPITKSRMISSTPRPSE